MEAAKQVPLLSFDAAIAALASRGQDDEIEAAQFELPLHDRYTLQRLQVPCRGNRCLHNECFELSSYASRNRNTSHPLCPICSIELPASELHIDELVLRLLVADDAGEATVTLTPDGHWIVAVPADAPANFVDLCASDENDDDEDDCFIIEAPVAAPLPRKRALHELPAVPIPSAPISAASPDTLAPPASKRQRTTDASGSGGGGGNGGSSADPAASPQARLLTFINGLTFSVGWLTTAVSGIGDARAERIVEHRDNRSGFSGGRGDVLAALEEVRGVGPVIAERIFAAAESHVAARARDEAARLARQQAQAQRDEQHRQGMQAARLEAQRFPCAEKPGHFLCRWPKAKCQKRVFNLGGLASHLLAIHGGVNFPSPSARASSSSTTTTTTAAAAAAAAVVTVASGSSTAATSSTSVPAPSTSSSSTTSSSTLPCNERWHKLSVGQQQMAARLGFEITRWNSDDWSGVPFDWGSLGSEPGRRSDAEALGFTPASWQQHMKNDQPSTCRWPQCKGKMFQRHIDFRNHCDSKHGKQLHPPAMTTVAACAAPASAARSLPVVSSASAAQPPARAQPAAQPPSPAHGSSRPADTIECRICMSEVRWRERAHFPARRSGAVSCGECGARVLLPPSYAAALEASAASAARPPFAQLARGDAPSAASATSSSAVRSSSPSPPPPRPTGLEAYRRSDETETRGTFGSGGLARASELHLASRSAFAPFTLRTKRVMMGKHDFGPAPVTFSADKIEWYPAEKYSLPDGTYPIVSVPTNTITAFQVDTQQGGLGIWSMYEPPFSHLLGDKWKPFCDRADPESSIFIEYDTQPYQVSLSGWSSQPPWPSDIVKVCNRLERHAQFVGPGMIMGRATARAQLPANLHRTLAGAITERRLQRGIGGGIGPGGAIGIGGGMGGGAIGIGGGMGCGAIGIGGGTGGGRVLDPMLEKHGAAPSAAARDHVGYTTTQNPTGGICGAALGGSGGGGGGGSMGQPQDLPQVRLGGSMSVGGGMGGGIMSQYQLGIMHQQVPQGMMGQMYGGMRHGSFCGSGGGGGILGGSMAMPGQMGGYGSAIGSSAPPSGSIGRGANGGGMLGGGSRMLGGGSGMLGGGGSALEQMLGMWHRQGGGGGGGGNGGPAGS